MSEEPTEKNKKQICPSCREGIIRRVTRDYKVTTPNNKSSTIANLSYEECPKCNDEFFSAEAMERISDKVSEDTDSLTLSDLKQIRLKLQSNMTLLGESLGLGSKTWMRWENGEQNISRSMGYFIRAMAKYPQVYQWVAQRGWRQEKGPQETGMSRPLTIDELRMEIMKQYLTHPSPESLVEEEDAKAMDSFVSLIPDQVKNAPVQSAFNFRRGDIQHVDSRFSEMEVA
jgi:putative zinc finger/helix-turn-helix YgiT family protein